MSKLSVHIDDEVLRDLRARIRNTRWPDAIDGAGWAYGTDPAYLRELADYWADEFDWPAYERALNRFEHHRAEIDGLGIHYVHARGVGPAPLPLVLTHGWPSSFLEYIDLIPALTDPAAHGGRASDAFDVVIPSLPGYGFSDRPRHPGIMQTSIADMWAELMVNRLGYPRFAAHGTDIGAGVTGSLGRRHPDRLVGIHLSGCSFPPPAPPLTAEETAFQRERDGWTAEEGGYAHMHSTKPQTLAYGLTDSPVGLAAWIVEKFRSWSDSGGDVESRFDRDLLLANITVYWATATINSSMRVYYEHRHADLTYPKVEVPSGFAIFANEAIPMGRAPRSLGERAFNVTRWTDFDTGGHFAALEEPDLLVREIREFFRDLR